MSVSSGMFPTAGSLLARDPAYHFVIPFLPQGAG